MAILKIRDADGNVQEIIAIKGEKGDPGETTIISPEDLSNYVIACGTTTIDGVEWYYRKWADGFAECWSSLHCDYETNGTAYYVNFLTPFNMSARGDLPNIQVTIASPYEFVYAGDTYEMDVSRYGMIVTVPDSATGDLSVAFTCRMYISGYWK